MACRKDTILFDLAEHYQKRSYRNRYYLASPEGKILMSIPLKEGRNQRTAVQDVCLDSNTDWQGNHWKTIVSLYRRSPFFEYFEFQLKPLFEKPYVRLHDWNIAGIRLLNTLLDTGLNLEETHNYQKQYPDEVLDLRSQLRLQDHDSAIVPYHQVFTERSGFLPDCSILDLLCCEGPRAKELIRSASGR